MAKEQTMISRRRALQLAPALAGIVALGPLGRGAARAQDETPAPGGTLIIGSIQEPDNLNPWLTATTVGYEVVNFVYEPLTRVDPDGNHIPVLAAEVPSPENGGISADLLSYTYPLRTDVTWSDGTPFTAEDVLFTYNAIADASVNAPGRLNFQYIESVAAPDPHTVVFTLNAPHGAFLETWVNGILPRHIFEGQDLNTTELNRAPSVGTGPYRFVEWRSGDAIIVERNENYWREGGYLDRIEYRIVPNSDTLLANLEAGEIDMRYVMTAEHVPIVRELEDYTVSETLAHAYFHFTINQQDPVVGDRLVRQALTYGLDKAAITETVLLDLVQPHWSPIARPSWAYVEPDPKMAFDQERARQLLDEAGWTGEGTRQKDGESLRIELMSIAGDTERQQVVQLAQAMWAEIGVEVEIAPVDLATFVAASNEGTYQIAYGFWGYGVDPSTYNGRWLSTSESNFLKYTNQEVDQILTRALQTGDREERGALYAQFQEIVIEEATNIYLYNRVLFDAVHNRVRGFAPNPGSGTNTWNVSEWWIAE
ncbi:MAG: ABC transporter substrate-binding protein [Thermomicrobiales bacterium]